MLPRSLRPFLVLLVPVFLQACTPEQPQLASSIEAQFNTLDSLVLTGTPDLPRKKIDSIRRNIKPSDPIMARYYRWMSAHYQEQPRVSDRYADSAMAVFDTEEKKKRFPMLWYEALVTKGDASIGLKRYNLALEYFFQARNTAPGNDCQAGGVSARIANIYYKQRNFHRAARHLAQSYRDMLACRATMSAPKFFFLAQGALDNTALAYEKAGMPDSAGFYYKADLDLIKESEKNPAISRDGIEDARFVVLENIGGLELAQGHLARAEEYLTRCLRINQEEQQYITLLIKIADLYAQKGDYARADSAFSRSRALLDKMPSRVHEWQARWYKLYAGYRAKRGDQQGAYAALNAYVTLKDSLDINSADISRIDVESEFDLLGQHEMVAALKYADGIKKLYITGFILLAVMALIIIFLVWRNLRKSRQIERDTTLYNEQLRKTMADLERANKNYIRIMRVMAHDMKNPLAAMTGLSGLLLDETGLTEEGRQMVKLIGSAGQNTIDMVDELLRNSLSDENEKIVTQEVDIRALLSDSVNMLRFKADEKRQHIVFSGEGEPVLMQLNHEKMWRVFNNLIGNAIKFSHEGGTIRVDLDIDGEQRGVLVSVTDEGIGIPESEQHHIFEMFTPAKRKGTSGEEPFGLGLSISRKIVEKHRGRIWFKSEPGKGTTFFIALPR